MISHRVSTQEEVDKALFEEFGLQPLDETTSDGTQRLYEDRGGKPYVLPCSNQGYSYYSVEDILGFIRKVQSGAKVASIHTYVAMKTK